MAGTGFSVDLSALEEFRAKLARSIDQNFGGSGPATGGAVAGGTNMAQNEFGAFREAQAAHGAYGPSRGSMMTLLTQVDDLINQMHNAAQAAAGQYQGADGASARANDTVRQSAGRVR